MNNKLMRIARILALTYRWSFSYFIDFTLGSSFTAFIYVHFPWTCRKLPDAYRYPSDDCSTRISLGNVYYLIYYLIYYLLWKYFRCFLIELFFSSRLSLCYKLRVESERRGEKGESIIMYTACFQQ